VNSREYLQAQDRRPSDKPRTLFKFADALALPDKIPDRTY
jgi:hypothetical protein